MYQNLVQLVIDVVFNGSIEGTMYGQLISEGIAACACCFLVALPFLIVWRFIRKWL